MIPLNDEWLCWPPESLESFFVDKSRIPFVAYPVTYEALEPAANNKGDIEHETIK